jgi:hypothetical protein
MKLKSLGLSSLQRSIARQESRILWLANGDSPIKFFHIHANARRRRKFIRSLEHDGQVLVSEDRKVEAFLNFFEKLLGSPLTRTHGLDLDRLQLPQLQLVTLENRFTEEEACVRGGGGLIKSLPPDKAPGPDGFTTCFF